MTYTIARIINSKPVKSNYCPKDQEYDQFSVFFTTNELGDQAVSTFSKYEMKVGQQIEGEITQKPGTNKAGEAVTYHNFSFAKKGGMSEAEKSRITVLENWKTTHEIRYNKLINLLIEKGIVPKPVVKIPGTEVEYPEAPQGEPFSPEEQGFEPDDLHDLR
jgi:hypothetical protein